MQADGNLASWSRAQIGSNSGSAIERGPRSPLTGAGRMSTIFAPCSPAPSRAPMIASSTIGSVITGVVKIRLW